MSIADNELLLLSLTPIARLGFSIPALLVTK